MIVEWGLYLITVCFTPVLLLKFLKHVYVYFPAYGCNNASATWNPLLSRAELTAIEYRRSLISSQNGSRFII